MKILICLLALLPTLAFAGIMTGPNVGGTNSGGGTINGLTNGQSGVTLTGVFRATALIFNYTNIGTSAYTVTTNNITVQGGGTGQIVTLPANPPAASLFILASTNASGSMIVTNATGFSTINNQLSWTNTGIASLEVYFDGTNYWSTGGTARSPSYDTNLLSSIATNNQVLTYNASLARYFPSNSVGGTSGTNYLPLDNVWTGLNTFSNLQTIFTNGANATYITTLAGSSVISNRVGNITISPNGTDVQIGLSGAGSVTVSAIQMGNNGQINSTGNARLGGGVWSFNAANWFGIITNSTFPTLPTATGRVYLGNTNTIPVWLRPDIGKTNAIAFREGETNGVPAPLSFKGETITTNIVVTNELSLVSGTAKIIASTNLTAGFWLISGIGTFHGISASPSLMVVGLQGNSGPEIDPFGFEAYVGMPATLATFYTSGTICEHVVNLTSTTTFNLFLESVFSAGAVSGSGAISAVRIY